MYSFRKTLCALAIALCGTAAQAGAITTYDTLSAFNTATSGLSVTNEDFTDQAHFPISSGFLDSQTTEAGLVAGQIKPGVAYSTPRPNEADPGFFFNIDAGGGFIGGFLDSLRAGQVLTIEFGNAVRFFGFDTNSLVGTGMNMSILFADNSQYDQFISPLNGIAMDFFGFGSSANDIVALTLGGGDGFPFAIDNFAFAADTGNNGGNRVPEPGALALMAIALGGLGWSRRKASR